MWFCGGGVGNPSAATHPPAEVMAVGHVGSGPGLIDENQSLRIENQQSNQPAVLLPQDVEPVLRDYCPRLFCTSYQGAMIMADAPTGVCRWT
jgi:hypothetical protein